MTIEIATSTEIDYLEIARAITNFNLSHLPPHSSDNMTSLGFVVRDNLRLIGGVYGKLILGNCLAVDVLWVAEPYRNNDFGSKLMEVLENAARSLGSHLSIVDTFEFQALEFYQKIGYEIFGVLDDCPCKGNKRYYLKKSL